MLGGRQYAKVFTHTSHLILFDEVRTIIPTLQMMKLTC